MKKKRIMSILIAGVLSTSLLVGCTSTKKDTSKSSEEVVVSEAIKEDSNEISEENEVIDTNLDKQNEGEKEENNKKQEEIVQATKKEEHKTSKPQVNNTSSNTSKPQTNNSTNNSKPQAQPKPDNTPVSEGEYLSKVEEEIFNAVNRERGKVGLAPLKRNSQANTYARSKSLEMLNLNYFDHKSPVNGYIQDIAKKDGWKYSRIGENIYTMSGGNAGNASGDAINNSWMNSEGHRKNILNSEYTDIGIGVVYRNGKLYATQIFYTPL